MDFLGIKSIDDLLKKASSDEDFEWTEDFLKSPQEEGELDLSKYIIDKNKEKGLGENIDDLAKDIEKSRETPQSVNLSSKEIENLIADRLTVNVISTIDSYTLLSDNLTVGCQALLSTSLFEWTGNPEPIITTVVTNSLRMKGAIYQKVANAIISNIDAKGEDSFSKQQKSEKKWKDLAEHRPFKESAYGAGINIKVNMTALDRFIEKNIVNKNKYFDFVSVELVESVDEYKYQKELLTRKTVKTPLPKYYYKVNIGINVS